MNDEIPYSLKVINSKWKVIKNKNLVIHQVILIPKLAYKKIGYYAPDTALFHGKSTNISDKELKNAIDALITVWKLQRN